MNRNTLWKIVFGCVALVLVLVILYSGLQILESTVFLHQQEETVVSRRTITRDGIDYFPRQDIRVVMILGIDRAGKVEASPEPNNGGAVDMITLMVFDEQTQTCNLLCLNRDTMLDMPMLDDYGREAGSFFGQLVYSHTYGTGVEDSCENTRKTVSNFLHGITIDYYFSMNMDAIAVLNDAVGGVTVTIRDDFSAVDPTLKKGVTLLKGQQAVSFVQSRYSVGDQLNLSRMERQKEYMTGFVSALKGTLSQEGSSIATIYEDVAEYIVTDCTVAVMSRLVEDYGEYSLGDVITLPGQNVLGEKYYEFYVDEEQLDEIVLELFYAPK